ncbi:MAG: inositol monophosphatase family protein, partial [Pseudomonadota bacterium]
DGTRGFISGTPTWGVLVAVGPATGPTLGLLDQPFTGERFLGEIGPGGSQRATWRREGPPEPITVRPCADMADAVLFSTYPEIGAPQERDAFARVASQAKLTRYGLDCYAYGLCAAGQVDLVIEAGLAPYDIQAPAALVIAAGGIVTDWEGGPAHSGGRAIAAGDARVHAQALELLAWKN